MIDVAEVNQRRWLEESGQWIENVDRTHLVLASGNPVLQKKFGSKFRFEWSLRWPGLVVSPNSKITELKKQPTQN